MQGGQPAVLLLLLQGGQQAGLLLLPLLGRQVGQRLPTQGLFRLRNHLTGDGLDDGLVQGGEKRGLRPRPGKSATPKSPAAQRCRQRRTCRPDRPTRAPAASFGRRGSCWRSMANWKRWARRCWIVLLRTAQRAWSKKSSGKEGQKGDAGPGMRENLSNSRTAIPDPPRDFMAWPATRTSFVKRTTKCSTR